MRPLRSAIRATGSPTALLHIKGSPPLASGVAFDVILRQSSSRAATESISESGIPLPAISASFLIALLK